MTRKDSLVFCLLIVTFLIWANSFIAIAALRRSTAAFDLVILRFVPVGVVSLVIAFGFYRRECLKLLRNHPWRILTISNLTVAGYNFFLNHAMGWVNPAASSLLISLTPLFTLFLAVRFLGESFTFPRLGGTLLAFGGLAVVVLMGKVGNISGGTLIPLDKLPYALGVMMASLCWSVSTILAKPLMTRYSPVAVNFLLLSVGSLPLFFLLDGRLVHQWVAYEAGQHIALAFLAFGCTVVAFALWFIALKHWKASNVTLFVYLNPPLTAVFDYFLNGHGITPFFALGGIAMLVGVILATRNPR